mgnify:CR=1 FL=1
MRVDGRANDALRPITIVPDYLDFAEGSALITWGKTRVLCAATVEEIVPPWLQGQGRGWVTGEYAMLPRSTPQRNKRETLYPSGRTIEIRRMIGRALRASVDLGALGERMITIDCDVIQADGGTRTAAVTGGYVALRLALHGLIERGIVSPGVLAAPVAAVSVGLIDREPLLDLQYQEDSHADVDLNAVMNAEGAFVEVQGAAEGAPFSRAELDTLLGLAERGVRELLEIQQQVIGQSLASRR